MKYVSFFLVFSALSSLLISSELVAKDKKVHNIPIDLILKNLYPQKSTEASCLDLSRKDLKRIAKIDGRLDKFLTKLKSGISTTNATKLLPLFHPRTVTNFAPVNELLSAMKLKLGAPFETSVFKIWAVNPVKGKADSVICGGLEHTTLQFWPQYGYKLEFAVWLQALGKQELGRVFATIVSKDDHWYIGAMHYHQWTHLSKDYEHWFASGRNDLANNARNAAFVKFDIASKLVHGEKQFRLSIQEQINAFQSKTISRKSWEANIRSTLKDWSVLYVNTILASNGAGIIIRVQVPKEISANELRKDCHKMGATLNQTNWFPKLDGFKCSYVIKGENPNKEGMLGGIYLEQKEIKAL